MPIDDVPAGTISCLCVCVYPGTTSRVARSATVGPASDASASPADTASPKRKERDEWEWEGGADEKRRVPAQMDNSLAGEGVDSQYGSMTDADVLEGVPDINMVREEVPDINMV